jgi:hypothetical protein
VPIPRAVAPALPAGSSCGQEFRSPTRSVTLHAAPSGHGVAVDLAHARQLMRSAEDGTLAAADLGDKFLRLTRAALGEPAAATLFERLQRPEEEADLSWVTGL